jgi:hypothetical protein
MNNSSKKLTQQLSNDNDASDSDPDSDNKEISDHDIEELEKLITSIKSSSPSVGPDPRVLAAAQDILQHSCGVISLVSLTTKTKLAAANLLVDDCLLICIEDLFQDIELCR